MKPGRVSAILLLIVVASTLITGCFHWFMSDDVSVEEATEVFAIQDDGADMFADLLEQQDPAAVSITVEWLQNQRAVEDARATESGNISIIYKCGINASILSYVPPANPGVARIPSVNSESQLPPIDLHESSSAPLAKETKQAIFLLPFEHQYGIPSAVPLLIEELQSLGYEVAGPLLNEDVTVSTYQSLGSYEFIYIFTHGNAHEISFLNQIAVATGARANPDSIRDTIRRISVGVEIMSIPDEGHFFAVNGRLLNNASYPDSLVMVNACESFKYRALANAFLDQGAGVFFGWTDLTWYEFIDVSTSLLAQLIGKPNYTAHDAYVMPAALDMWNYHGEFSIDGIFPVERTYNGKTYNPDLRMDGNEDYLLNPLIYAESNNDLYTVNPSRFGDETRIGRMMTSTGASPNITDIAWDNSECALYATSFDQLYQIDLVTITLDPIGTGLGSSDVNALTADAKGNLYAMTVDGELLRVNASTGIASRVGELGISITGSGDLAFSPDGSLYGAVRSTGSANDELVEVDASDGRARRIGSIGYDAVFGLFFVGEDLYGVTADSELIFINTSTGNGVFVRGLSFSAWGAQDLGE